MRKNAFTRILIILLNKRPQKLHLIRKFRMKNLYSLTSSFKMNEWILLFLNAINKGFD